MIKRKSDSGVSELIGAILLVSLVVMLMMVVTTVVISQPQPEKIPELSSSISVRGSGPYDVYITHIGGDALLGGEYLVLIDGNEIAQDLYREPPPNNVTRKEEWTFSKPVIVIYNRPSIPKSVELYYSGPSSKVLLAKTNLD